MNVKFFVPEFPPIWSYLPDLFRIYRNGQFSNRGPMVQKFEQQLKTYLNCYKTSPVCVDNATTGLEIALKALKLPAGSKVLVPSMTFAASVMSIKNAGLVPVYCDISMDDLCVTVSKEMGKVSNPKSYFAIMPVCAYGNRINDGIISFAKNNDLKIIVDAAGAIGTEYPQPYYDAIVYSFHATKTLPVGEGGCIVFSDPENEKRARKMIDFGFNSSRECEYIGTNGKMSEVHAAIGIQSLKRLSRILESRSILSNWYKHVLKNLKEKGLVKFQTGGGLQLFTIICKDEEFKSLLEYHLNSNGVETRVYYKPCHNNGVLSNEEKITTNNTDNLKDRILSLPFYSKLTFKQMDHIEKTIKNWELYK